MQRASTGNSCRPSEEPSGSNTASVFVYFHFTLLVIAELELLEKDTQYTELWALACLDLDLRGDLMGQ
jgi:hypothetical protein